MLNILNLVIQTQIYESANSIVYRGLRDKQPIIIKILKENYPTPSELARYRTEYKITKSLNLPGVIEVYDLQKYQNSLMMLLEDFNGQSLKFLLDQKSLTLTLSEFLEIAINITETLGQIHSENIIHKDINPSNIVFNPTTGQLKIIDFGISTRLNRENTTLKNPNLLEGTLAYISPEQTGRMNRTLDYRTDYYSLGVSFYEILTHQLPFVTEDPLELIHCHIAKQPIPPHQVNPQIPTQISAIIMKLMAKTAEERYQSAFGLKADLHQCLKQLQTNKIIYNFPLARQDITDKFQIPQKLYGRETEVAILTQTFDRVLNPPANFDIASPPEIMLIAGYSGIGKSALVQEIYKQITEKRGYFISGKFDQYQRNIPYSAQIYAFRELIKQLLTESETNLQRWREKLLTALGVNGQVIIDIIPELELIIGPQEPVLELGANEAQNRFNLIFQNFLNVFCKPEHPLVIFLDDLQWADSATLKLIKLIITDESTKNLFLIGAYRDNEVNASHPLMLTLESIRNEGIIVNQITLEPLKIEHITKLIAETLNRDEEVVKSLAELVVKKTGGNPFFVNEFLKTLHSENLFKFNSENLKWDWNVEEIEAQGITNNVVELMLGNLKKLPKLTQDILRLAACIGAKFDLPTLAIIWEKRPEEVFAQLSPALEVGLILPLSELDSNLLIQNYKFLHDRVQQAAYTLIAEHEKKAVHLQIGRLLQVSISTTEKETKIFDLVEHFNLGRELITELAEKIDLAKLNLSAARKAKDATAYLAAQEYLAIGISLLSGNFWEEEYQLALELHKEQAEIAYLNSNFDEAEKLIYLVISKCRTNLEKAEIYNILIVMLTMMAKYEEAVTAARQALNLFGIELTDRDFSNALQKELAAVRELWQPGEISPLLEQPEMTDLAMKAALTLLVSVDPAAYLSNGELYGIIAAKMAYLSLKYGPIAASAKGYTSYGIVLSSVLQEYRSGYEFARLGLNLAYRFNDSSMKAKAANNIANLVQHWVIPMKEAEKINNEGYQAGLESGELQFAGYLALHQMVNFFVSGKILSEILAVLNDYLKFTAKTKNLLAYHSILACQLPIYNLSGLSPNPKEFASESLTEAEYIEDCQKNQNFFALCNYLTYKAQVLYLYGDYQAALNCLQESQTMLPYLQGMITSAVNNFYTSLILAALYPTVSQAEQISYQQQITNNQKQMKLWADNCPENFLHKYYLVEAEIARNDGQILTAMALYDKAIANAKANDYLQEVSLASELTAKFYLAQNKEFIARAYMQEAHYHYQLWGATAKRQDLEKLYPELLTANEKKTKDTTTTALVTTSGAISSLDIATVMKATQAISGAILLPKLLSSLMKILIENAGAERGYLILSRQGKLLLEALGTIDGEQVTFLESQPITNCDFLPESLINYVARTQTNIVLNEALKESKFNNDPYIQKYQPKSILCVPLINQSRLVSIVYLENNLTTRAFTAERVEVLKLLSGQAAISIENAQLYATLEDANRTLETKVAERTHELSQTLENLKNTQKQLVESEKMAALGGLVAGVAHEINTPIGIGVTASSSLAQKAKSLAETYKSGQMKRSQLEQFIANTIEISNLLLNNLQRAATLVTNFKQVAVEQTSETKQPLLVKECLQNCLTILKPRWEQTQQKIKIKGDDQLVINSYSGALSQIINHLITNSLNHGYNPQDQGQILIEFEVDNNQLNLIYSDDGQGISPENMPKIFEPFFTTKRGQGSQGLGLPIVYNLVTQKLLGKIDIESYMGQGTKFIISFPVEVL